MEAQAPHCRRWSLIMHSHESYYRGSIILNWKPYIPPGDRSRRIESKGHWGAPGVVTKKKKSNLFSTLKYLFIYSFIYFYPKGCPIPSPLSQNSPISPSHSPLRGCPIPGYPSTLGHHVSIGFGASAPTEARQGSSPLTNSCMLFCWWLSLWDLPGVQDSWHCWASLNFDNSRMSIEFSKAQL